MEISNNIHRMLYNRCTLNKGTISYSCKHNGGRLWVRETVSIPEDLRLRLKQINSTLYFKWDRWHLCWNVVHKRPGAMPYIVFPVQDEDGSYRPIDNRAFEQIRRSIWWSTEGIKRQARAMEIKAEYARQKLDKDQKQDAKDFAKAIASPVMT
ncbi:hypothetical protein LCGC14_1661020, partial [marine sediment metagenome]